MTPAARPPSPVSRPIFRLCLGGLVLASLAGCVYLRLLDVKKQLKDFDANFALFGRPELVIRFKNPALYAKDARYLIGADPLTREPEASGEVWDYEFEMARKEPVPPTLMEKLSLRLRINGKRLEEIRVPETFMLLFSRNVLMETLRQAADAEVLEMAKTARAKIRLSPHTDAELPSLDKTHWLLGDPLEVRQEGEGLLTLGYRYRIIGAHRDVPILAWLTFSPDNMLRRVVVTWDTATVDAEFLRD